MGKLVEVLLFLFLLGGILIVEKKIIPSTVFAIEYIFLISVSMLCNGLSEYIYDGIIYIEICCLLFYIGEILSRKIVLITFKVKQNKGGKTINISRVNSIMYGLIIIGVFLTLSQMQAYDFFSFFINIYLYSLSSYLSSASMSIFEKILLVAFFAGFILDGYVLVYSKIKEVKYRSKAIIIFGIMIIYSIVIAKKGWLVASFVLFLSGILTALNVYYDDYKKAYIFIKQNIGKIIWIMIVFILAILFLIFIRNSSDQNIIHTLGEYIFDEIYVFACWFDDLDSTTLMHTNGKQLFFAFFEQLGLDEGLFWNWPQNAKAMSLGVSSNIYTTFWTVIQDFGYQLSYLFWLLLGLVSGIIVRKAKNQKGSFLNIFLLLSIYFFILYSFFEPTWHTMLMPLSHIAFLVYLIVSDDKKQIHM